MQYMIDRIRDRIPSRVEVLRHVAAWSMFITLFVPAPVFFAYLITMSAWTYYGGCDAQTWRAMVVVFAVFMGAGSAISAMVSARVISRGMSHNARKLIRVLMGFSFLPLTILAHPALECMGADETTRQLMGVCYLIIVMIMSTGVFAAMVRENEISYSNGIWRAYLAALGLVPLSRNEVEMDGENLSDDARATFNLDIDPDLDLDSGAYNNTNGDEGAAPGTGSADRYENRGSSLTSFADMKTTPDIRWA